MALKPKYRLVFSREFDKAFSKLSKDIQSVVLEKIRDLRTDPYLGKPLKAGLKGLWSLRVGKYRAVYKVVHDEGMVQLITIEHRKKVYRAL